MVNNEPEVIDMIYAIIDGARACRERDRDRPKYQPKHFDNNKLGLCFLWGWESEQLSENSKNNKQREVC